MFQETSMAANPIELPSLPLRLNTSTSNGTATIQCSGKMTNDTAPLLKREVKEHLGRGENIVIDLSDVSQLDSMALGTLVGLYISARSAQVDFKLINLNQRIKELLRLTKLANVFEGYGEHL
jgi:anti-anti-sigma factor